VAPDIGGGIGAGWPNFLRVHGFKREYAFHQPGGGACAAQPSGFNVRNDEDGAAPLIVHDRNVTRSARTGCATIVDDAMHGRSLRFTNQNLTVA
jgi:hypothetical protein